MRTKTLLIAAAALAAGVFASQAQSNVYSANIVGYVNATNQANNFVMLANPLDNGTNDLYSLVPTAPNGSSVSVFIGGVVQTSSKTKGTWSTDYIVPPGGGFFLKSPNDGTNTLVGQTGFTNGLFCPAGTYVLAGSPIPFAGVLSDTGTNTMNLNALPNGSSISMLINGTMQTASKTKGAWAPNFTIGPGQGFYIKSPSDTNIIQILSLQ